MFYLLLNIPSGSITVAQWAGILVGSVIFVLAARVGVIAAMLSKLTLNWLYCAPLTLDFSRWYAWRTEVIAVLLLLIALWGFRGMMGRRRILSASILEG